MNNLDEIVKEFELLREENEELKKKIDVLYNKFNHKGRIKDSGWMMERRQRFAELYNQGINESGICSIMQISARTYARLKKYALDNMLISNRSVKEAVT